MCTDAATVRTIPVQPHAQPFQCLSNKRAENRWMDVFRILLYATENAFVSKNYNH